MTPVEDPTDTDALQRAVAATYNPQNYRSSWAPIRQYAATLNAMGIHPEKGSSAISTIVDLPRERIRSWVDDNGKPQQVHALNRLGEREWYPATWTDDAMLGLNALTAAVYAGGSINSDQSQLRITVEDSENTVIQAAARCLGVEWAVAATNPVEVRPRADGPLLGRVLAALGAPVGPKTGETPTGLPPYLDAAPPRLRLDFAQVYVTFRAASVPGRRHLQITEDRPEVYRERLAAFLASVTNRDDVRGGSYPIRLYGDARDTLSEPASITTRQE